MNSQQEEFSTQEEPFQTNDVARGKPENNSRRHDDVLNNVGPSSDDGDGDDNDVDMDVDDGKKHNIISSSTTAFEGGGRKSSIQESTGNAKDIGEGDDDENDNNNNGIEFDIEEDGDHDDDEGDDHNDDDDSKSDDKLDSSDGSLDDDHDNHNADIDIDGSKEEETKDGVSAYERLRLERIKRNQQRLAQLGLLGLKPEKRKNRRATREQVEKRQSLSRLSKEKEVDYSGVLDIRMIAQEKPPREKTQNKVDGPEKSHHPRKEKKTKDRLARFIYDEFARIKSHRRLNLVQAKRNYKQSQREVRYWRTEVQQIVSRIKKQHQMELLAHRQAKERAIFGGVTQQELLNEIDVRTPELARLVAAYDSQVMQQQQALYRHQALVVQHKKKLELERKLEMIEALDKFPKAFNEAIGTLNSLLYARSPKDPPPPRRSKRSRDDEETAPIQNRKSNSSATPKGKRAKTVSTALGSPSSPNDMAVEDAWSHMVASMATVSGVRSDVFVANPSRDIAISANVTNSSTNASNTNKQQKKHRDARNIGGWISPHFSQELDRSWLTRSKPLKPAIVVPSGAVGKGDNVTMFDLKGWVPQVGEVVLYYPSAHKEFLKVYPDKLGSQLKNLLRVPIWQRGKRAIARRKAGRDDVGDEGSTWWTEAWVESLVSGSGSTSTSPALGDFPIVCRVERTHAEFPPDPYSKEKAVNKAGNETTIIWKGKAAELVGASAKAKMKKRVSIRLAVLLKPLTTILPDESDGSGETKSKSGNDPLKRSLDSSPASLDLPPNFTVVTVPVASPQEPFLVPFIWAYTTFHSLSIGDPVWVRNAVNDDTYNLDDSETKKAGRSPATSGKGRIISFSNRPVVEVKVHPDGGKFESAFSCRLDDKIDLVEELLANLKNSGLPLEQRVDAILSTETSPCKIPVREMCNVIDFLFGYLTTKDTHGLKRSDQARPKAIPSLTGLIHMTLPTRHAVFVALDTNRRQLNKSSPWSVVPLQPITAVKNSHWGFLPSIESSWREKAILCIQDLIENNPAAEIFVREIFDEDVPNYYCAVPVAMHLGRILERLRSPPGHSDCYYTSLESIATDLHAIVENCMLYNSPESAIVTTCNDMISSLKKSIAALINQYEREGKSQERPKLDTVSKTGNNNLGRVKNTVTTIPQDLNMPFKFAIQGNYQPFDPNLPRVEDDNSEQSLGWIPQCGDVVLYSTSKHRDFVQSHQDSLSIEHLNVPDIRQAINTNGKDTGDNVSMFKGENQHIEKDCQPEEDGFLCQAQSHWLEGMIVSVRSGFPCTRNLKEGPEQFPTSTIVFIVELRLRYTLVQNSIVVCWSPNKSTSQLSFLRPVGVTAEEGVKILPGDVSVIANANIPMGASICLDFLKRRCLNGVPADKIDRDQALEKAQRGSAVHSGTRLPTFGDFLAPPRCPVSSNETRTRGIKKGIDEGTIVAMNKLADTGYLPLWTRDVIDSQQEKIEHSVPLRHETLLPFPNLCLELVRLRIVHGYYRTPMAILNDMSESYISTVFFLLYGPSTRSKDRISIRRLAKYLASPKGNGKFSKSSTNKKGKENADDHNVQKTAPAKQSYRETKETLLDEFSPEEMALIDRICRIRKTHAFAFVCLTATTQVERLFCFRFKSTVHPPPKAPEEPSGSNFPTVSYNGEQLAAIGKIRYLLKAAGKDPGRNRFKFAYSGKYRIRIKCYDHVIASRGQLEYQSDGTTLFEPAYAVACTSDRPDISVRITVSGSTICGEQFVCPPSTSPSASTIQTDIAEQVNSTAPTELSTKVAIYGKDTIELDWQTVEKNEHLARALFGQPGIRFPCVRCQVQGASFVVCRIRRGHSNLDFGLEENFKGSGGIDAALLQPWNAAIAKPVDSTSAKIEPEEGTTAIETGVTEHSTSATTAEWEKQATEWKGCLAKAEEAYKLSAILCTQADLLFNAEIRLSDEFICETFPLDPEDGHYIYCTVCGLSGNLVCCDAPGCPNVVHPKCIGIDLKDLPDDDDWYCPKCVARGAGMNKSATCEDALSTRKDVEVATREQRFSPNCAPPKLDFPSKDPRGETTSPAASQKETSLEATIAADPDPKPEEMTKSLPPNRDGPMATSEASPPSKTNGRALSHTEGCVASSAGSVHHVPADTVVVPPNSAQQQATANSQQADPSLLHVMTDDEVDEKLSIVSDILTDLRVIRDPSGNESNSRDEENVGDNGEDDGRDRHDEDGRRSMTTATTTTTGQTGKRGRPRKSPELDNLPDQAKRFLKDKRISSGDAFLAIPTSELSEELNRWRISNDMKPLAGSGSQSVVSSWKGIVRRAAGAGGLGERAATDGSTRVVSDAVTEPPHPDRAPSIVQKRGPSSSASEGKQMSVQLTEPSSPPPRSRKSIEKRAAAAAEASEAITRRESLSSETKRIGRPPERPIRVSSSSKDESDRRTITPLDSLPTLGRDFCAWAGITDPQDLVDRKAGDLAEDFKEYRKKEHLPALNGSGNSAYVSAWKSRVRRELAFASAKDTGEIRREESKEEAEQPFAFSGDEEEVVVMMEEGEKEEEGEEGDDSDDEDDDESDEDDDDGDDSSEEEDEEWGTKN